MTIAYKLLCRGWPHGAGFSQEGSGAYQDHLLDVLLVS